MSDAKGQQRPPRKRVTTGAGKPRLWGIDIGGSGIKAAPVDPEAGRLLARRRRVDTPQPATTEAVADAVAELLKSAGIARDEGGLVGVAFPSIIEDGIVRTAVNIDESWLNANLEDVLGERLGRSVAAINDADAAGLAEMHFGAARGEPGTVVMLTLGTGIGSALFVDGALLGNTELAHLEIFGQEAEELAAGRIRKEKKLTWPMWAARLNLVLERIEMLIRPRLIIIGGGISQDHAKFVPLLHTRAELRPATLGNDAGIIGAALQAHLRARGQSPVDDDVARRQA